jgi:hypothetical protein
MTPTEVQALITEFEAIFDLAQKVKTYRQARERCQAIQAQLDQRSPTIAPLIQLLWNECLNARRSAAFWHELSDVEKTLSDNLSEQNIQLQQNYLRLVQEQ